MKTRIQVIISLLGGIGISLLTGLLNTTSIGFLGVIFWGLPFPWLSQVVYPGTTKEIIWFALFLDILVWFGVIFIIIEFI